MSRNLYRTTLRPASGGGMPPGVKWAYVEAPAMFGLANRPDLPTSIHRYGVVSTDRELTVVKHCQYCCCVNFFHRCIYKRIKPRNNAGLMIKS